VGHLGIERAHIVGHSSSVAIALQLAIDAPHAVQTVVSMDAARPVPPTEAQAAFVREFVEPAVRRYRSGDRKGAVDSFLRGVFGSNYRDPLERGLRGAFDQAVSDADAFFGQELPALERWSFTQADARRVAQPVLAVVGENSARTFPERRELLLSWLPNVEPFELPGATHLLHLQNPRGMVEALASFYERHALSPAANLKLDLAGDARDGSTADPNRSVRITRDVDASGAAQCGALARDVGRARAAGAEQPLGD
jgi:pimeloyl-ACP methyl ester carboxylesterase